MWIENNNKERVKSYLKSDIESSITNLTDISNKLFNTVYAIRRTVDGTASGIDQKMTDDCQIAIQQIGSALSKLYHCKESVELLETKEWVDNE